MIDFYYQLRQRMIDAMQKSLKQIRQVLGFGVQEFSDIVGLTRQTINNLEGNKSKMSGTQYIAICAVIDYCIKEKPELLSVLSTILMSNDIVNDGDLFSSIENGSLLKKWFLCFPDNSKITGIVHGESDVINERYFDGIANSYKIFLDDTILCEESFSYWINSITEIMKKDKNRFLVPLKVVEFMQEKICSDDPLVIERYQRGLNLLMKMQKLDLVEIRGEKGDVNIISTFISVFAKFKCVNRLALITESYKLANQVLSLNNDDIGGFNIMVTKFDKDLGLIKWNEDNYNEEVENIKEFTEVDDTLKGWEAIN